MKKVLCAVLICVIPLMLLGCSKAEQAADESQWDCSVVCAEESADDSYVITYSGKTVVSNTGILTLQNRNDFEIVVHLSCDGQEEQIFEIQPGGLTVFHQAVKNTAYTVGIHAEVEEGTQVKLMVYDGENAEVY